MEEVKRKPVRPAPKKEPKKLKIVVVGESKAGKTAICKRLTQNYAPANHEPTVGSDFFQTSLKAGSDTVLVSMWDLGGAENFLEVRNEFYRESHVLLLVFDVALRRSFDALDMW